MEHSTQYIHFLPEDTPTVDHGYSSGWYFEDETNNFNGPYPDAITAYREFCEYCQRYLFSGE